MIGKKPAESSGGGWGKTGIEHKRSNVGYITVTLKIKKKKKFLYDVITYFKLENFNFRKHTKR